VTESQILVFGGGKGSWQSRI